jgi:hypothetical protein
MRLGVRRRSVVAVVAVLGAVGFGVGPVAQVQAQPPARVRLAYDRGEGATSCPDAQAFADGVAGRLGYEPFDAGADGLVRVTVGRRERALEARIEMVDANGKTKAERLFTSRRSDCAELAATMELAIAIALDPFHATAPERAAAADSNPTPPPPASSPPPMVLPRPAPEPDARSAAAAVPAAAPRSPGPTPLAWEVGFAAVGGTGSEPVGDLGAEVRVAARRRDLSLAIEGRADLPASVPLQVGQVSTSLLVASLVPCAHWRILAACGLVTAGVLRAAGHGLVDERQVSDPWLALGARVAVEIRVTSRLFATAHADVATPLIETELKVGGDGVWTPPPVSFLGGLGLAVAFP